MPEPDLLVELQHNKNTFNQKFSGSPLKRAKLRGYLRNVAVALGNSKNVSAVPGLAYVLFNNPDPLVRGHAAWALGIIEGESARAALSKALVKETESEVVTEVQKALGY
jgi:epoxyqueuosine reductase